MRLLLPIVALVTIIALRRFDRLRGLSSAGGRVATRLAGSGSRFGFGPGCDIGAVRAKAAEPGGTSALLSRGRSGEGSGEAVAEVPPDAATTRGEDPDPPRSDAMAKARRGLMDGTHDVHEPRARFEEARGQLMHSPSCGDDVLKLEEPVSGTRKERRASGVTSNAVSQSTQGGAECQRRTARNAMWTSVDVGGEAAEGGLLDMQQGVMGLIEGVAQTNLRLTRELFRMSDPAALVELQQHFAREYTDALLQGGAAVARAVRRTADETLRPLDRQIERQRSEATNQDEGRL